MHRSGSLSQHARRARQAHRLLPTAQQRFNMLLMGVFGAAALLLAAIGIYGLMAYTVEQRTPEIGIRMALGAEARQVRNMVVRQGMTLAAMGLGAGLAASWVLARLFQSLLFGVKPRDPLVFTAVPLLLGLVGLIPVWLPAAGEPRQSGGFAALGVNSRPPLQPPPSPRMRY